MPFDSSPTNTVADVLRRAKALIDTPEKWGKGRTGWGNTEKCTGGAIMWAIREVRGMGDSGWDDAVFAPAFNAFKAANKIECIPSWNDAEQRTHADVIAALDKAIALAEAEG